MLYIAYSELVPYSAEQMFSLVNDINAYHKFIPGCIASSILEQKGSKLIAKINIHKAGIYQSFTTCNIFIKNESIFMRLVEGPFNFFIGNWNFIPLNEKISKIEFYLNLEYQNKLIDLIFRNYFKETANNTIKIFLSRAKEIYHLKVC